MRLGAPLVWMSGAISLVSCGAAPGSARRAIGPTGGELCLADRRFCLIVPRGALEEEVVLSIHAEHDATLQREAFVVRPEAPRLVGPARLELRYDPSSDGGSPTGLRIFRASEEGWSPLDRPSLDRATHTLGGETLLLGRFAAFSITDLLPFEPPRDAGALDAGRDAGTTPPRDAGAPDAGQRDAGAPDAGQRDAGAPDAGQRDAGAPDAGQRDAGPADAGVGDAGIPVDAGFDAGTQDAGFDAGGPDGGSEDDAGADGGPEDAG